MQECKEVPLLMSSPVEMSNEKKGPNGCLGYIPGMGN